MKKQLIIVGSVLVAALLLFGLYEFVFKNDTAPDQSDSFYTLSDPVTAKIKKIEDKVEIVFSGVSEKAVTGDEYLNRDYKFALSYHNANGKIKVKFDESGSYKGIIFKKDSAEKQISFDELYKSLEKT
jgi:uncharacterized protein YdeI (BOF family)